MAAARPHAYLGPASALSPPSFPPNADLTLVFVLVTPSVAPVFPPPADMCYTSTPSPLHTVNLPSPNHACLEKAPSTAADLHPPARRRPLVPQQKLRQRLRTMARVG